MRANSLLGIGILVEAFSVSTTPVWSKSLLVDISKCTNDTFDFGQPIGTGKGNAGTDFAKIEFDLIDFKKKNNFWRGINGAAMIIDLAVPKATAVQILINTGWGQSGIPNALVTVHSSGGAKKTLKLVGNKTIRDFNNWIFTNSINGKDTQEWWTNNKKPQTNDQSHRYDAHVIDISGIVKKDTLTQIVISAPQDAATGFFEPFVFAVNVEYPGQQGPKPKCTGVV
jgi:hypothetical protein